MERYLFLKLFDNTPIEIKHFTDRSAGIKYLAEQSGIASVSDVEAQWSNELHRARVSSFRLNGPEYWLYQVIIY